MLTWDRARALIVSLAGILLTAVLAVNPRIAILSICLSALIALGAVGATRPRFGLCAIFFLLTIVPTRRDFGLPGGASTWVYAAAVFFVACGTLGRRARKQASDGEVLGLAVVLAGVCATWFASTQLFSGVFSYTAIALIAWHVVAEARMDARVLDRTLVLLTWISVPLSTLAISERLLGRNVVLSLIPSSLPGYINASASGRSVAMMEHPIVYGGFCMAIIIITMVTRPRWSALFIAMNVTGLVLSGARSAWIATALAVAIWTVAQRRWVAGRGTTMAIGFAAGALTLWAVAPSFLGHIWVGISNRVAGVDSVRSAEARGIRVEAAWPAITESPKSLFLGHGPGASSRFFWNTGVSDGLALVIDNSYVSLWMDLGALALAVLLAIFTIGVLRNGAAVGRLLLLAVAVQAWFFDFYGWPAVAMLIPLGLGLRLCTFGPPLPVDLPMDHDSRVTSGIVRENEDTLRSGQAGRQRAWADL